MGSPPTSAAPPLRDDQVELEPRRHTIEPIEIPVVELHKEVIEQMSSEDLRQWIWVNMGLSIDPTWPKSRVVTWLVQQAIDCLPA